ncbi:MAG: ArdC-like ssDNA-binding domain-containing protein [Chromatiaceae bacterium]
MFLDLYRQRTPLAFAEVTQQMGLNLRDENGTLAEGKIPGIPQFLNRLLSLKTDMQNAVFDEFERRLVEAVEYAKQQGSYDEGLQTLRALRIEKTRDEVVYTHKTGAETRYVELAVTNEIPYLPWEEISQMALLQAQREGAQRSLSGWLVSEQGKTKGQVLYLLDRGLRLNAEGVESHRGTLYGIRKGAHRYIDNADELARGYAMRQIDGRYREVQITRAIPPEEAERLWRAQLQAAPATQTRREAMLVGAILPIWDRVAGGSTIYRLQTDAGEQLLGRRLGGGAAKQTLKNLGLDSGAAKLAASDLFAAIQAGQKAVLSNGWEIVSVRVAHERRIEVRQRASFTEAEKRILKSQGAFVERISWAERVFIPVGAEGLGVFERITDSKPVVDLFGKASPEEAAAADAVEDDGALGYGAPDHPALSPSADAHPATQPVAVHLQERRDMGTNKTPYAEQVATKVIAQLQAGSAPWQMPWKPGELRLPYNAATGKGYRGMNTIWLQMQGHADPRWLTYRQAQAEGAQVRKGETGTRVIYWKLEDEQTMKDDQGRPVLDEEGQPRKIRVKLERPRSFSAVVFNAEQIDGLPALEARPVGQEPERHARAEAILDHCGAQIAYAPGGRRAFYRPSTDTIQLPERNQFATADGFYATALHEVGHYAGAKIMPSSPVNTCCGAARTV